MRSLTRPLAVIMFFALASMPVILFGVDGSPYGGGSLELREQAPFPMGWAPHMFRRMSDWFNDRIGLRQPLFRLGSDMNIILWRSSTNRRVVLTTDNWLFFTDEDDQPAFLMLDLRGQLRFQPAEINKIDYQLRTVHQTLRSCGKTGFVLIAPNKQSIYGEHLVGNEVRSTTRFDELLERLSPEAASMIVDVRPRLRQLKRTETLPLYMKTDTHWTDIGAFYAYQRTVEALARLGRIAEPQLASLNYYQTDVQSYQGGDLAVRMLFAPWRFPDERITLRPYPTLPEISVAHVREGYRTYSNVAGKGNLLLLGDSFSAALGEFFARHFARVDHYFHGYALEDLRFRGDLIAESQADVVLVEIVERHLPQLLLEPHELFRACGGGDARASTRRVGGI